MSIPNSKSFRECEQIEKQEHPYNQLHEKHSALFGMQIRGRLDLACTGVWFVENKDAINVAATIFVAFFTLTLWQSTNRLARSADDQRRENQSLIQASIESAKAATISANAALGVELPRLELHYVRLVHGPVQPAQDMLRIGNVEISFFNHGRTTAHLIETHINKHLGEFLTYPPEYNFVDTKIADIGDIVRRDTTYDFSARDRIGVDEKTAKAIMAGTETLYVYGFIGYRDFLGGRWRTKFCVQFQPQSSAIYTTMSPDSGTFAEISDPEYTGRERY